MKKIELASGIIAFVLLLFFMISSIFYARFSSWGFNHFWIFSIPLRIAISVICLLFIIPKSNQVLANQIESIIKNVKRFFNEKPELFYITMGLAFLVLFIALSSNRFYGDHKNLLYMVEYAQIVDKVSYVFNPIIHILMHKLTSLIGFSARASIVLVNALWGVGYVFTSYFLVKELTANNLKRFILFLLFFSSGLIQIFFGTIEMYAPVIVCILLFALTALYYIKGKTRIIVPTIVVMISFYMYVLSIFLFPALFLLPFFKTIGNKKNKKKIHLIQSIFQKDFFSILKLFFIFIGILVLLGIFLYNSDISKNQIFSFTLSKDASTTDSFLKFDPRNCFYCMCDHVCEIRVAFKPLNDIEDHTNQAYSLFSKKSLNDQFNQFMLSELPGFILAAIVFIFLFRKIQIRDPFLLFLLSLILLLFIPHFFMTPIPIGMIEDWDAYSLLSVPLLVIAGYLLSRYIKEKKTFAYVALSIIVVLLMHTISWLLYNRIV